MIILTQTTDNLQAALGGAVTTNQMQCTAYWRDVTTTTYTPGRTLINTNGATDVNVVGAPGASTQRVVDFVSVYNNDTVSQTLTIKLDANATEYILWKGILNAGERLEYVDGQGFRVFTNTGGEKVQSTVGMVTSTTFNIVVMQADVANADAVANTLYNATGLAFNVLAGNTYYFEAFIPYTSAATATGSRWTLTGPAITMLNYTSEYTLAATTKTLNSATAWQIPAASNATSLAAGNMATIWGIFKPAADGTVQVQFASEITVSAITAKAGALIRWIQVL